MNLRTRGTSLLAIATITFAILVASTTSVRASNVTFILYQGTKCPNTTDSFCFGDGKAVVTSLTVNKGDFVNITVYNNDTITHTFTITTAPYTSINIINAAGEHHNQTFTASTAGSFTFICTQDSHSSLGMTGTLTVKTVTTAPVTPIVLLSTLLLATAIVYASRRRL